MTSKEAAVRRLMRQWLAAYKKAYGPEISMMVYVRLCTILRQRPMLPTPARIKHAHEKYSDGTYVELMPMDEYLSLLGREVFNFREILDLPSEHNNVR